MSCCQQVLTYCKHAFNDSARPACLLKNAAARVTSQATTGLRLFSSSTVSVCCPVNPAPFLLYGDTVKVRRLPACRQHCDINRAARRPGLALMMSFVKCVVDETTASRRRLQRWSSRWNPVSESEMCQGQSIPRSDIRLVLVMHP